MAPALSHHTSPWQLRSETEPSRSDPAKALLDGRPRPSSSPLEMAKSPAHLFSASYRNVDVLNWSYRHVGMQDGTRKFLCLAFMPRYVKVNLCL